MRSNVWTYRAEAFLLNCRPHAVKFGTTDLTRTSSHHLPLSFITAPILRSQSQNWPLCCLSFPRFLRRTFFFFFFNSQGKATWETTCPNLNQTIVSLQQNPLLASMLSSDALESLDTVLKGCQGMVFLKLEESDAGSNAKKSENGNQGELSDPPNMIKGVSVLNIRPSW